MRGTDGVHFLFFYRKIGPTFLRGKRAESAPTGPPHPTPRLLFPRTILGDRFIKKDFLKQRLIWHIYGNHSYPKQIKKNDSWILGVIIYRFYTMLSLIPFIKTLNFFSCSHYVSCFYYIIIDASPTIISIFKYLLSLIFLLLFIIQKNFKYNSIQIMNSNKIDKFYFYICNHII